MMLFFETGHETGTLIITPGRHGLEKYKREKNDI